MTVTRRAAIGLAILSLGLASESAVERATRTERPPLKRSLASIPLSIGSWDGQDEPIDPEIERESQATEFLNRVYTLRTRPGVQVWLWINYSERGLNLRHSPAVCLPSGGWGLSESMSRVLSVRGPGGQPQRISLLGYEKGELVQRIGFWYDIYGEGSPGAIRPRPSDREPEQPRSHDPGLRHDGRDLLPGRRGPR